MVRFTSGARNVRGSGTCRGRLRPQVPDRRGVQIGFSSRSGARARHVWTPHMQGTPSRSTCWMIFTSRQCLVAKAI